MKTVSKKSNILATIIWIISFILAFKIPPESNFIWLPDALLLFGFFPLLIPTKSPWLWLGFGVLDTIAGTMLLIAGCLPKTELEFVRLEQISHFPIIEMITHILNYHPYYTWMIIGILCTIIGLALLLFRLFFWLGHKYKKKKI